MGLDFTLYENNSYNDVEIKKVYEIEEIMYLSNHQAMLLTNWFYREDGDELKHNYNQSRHYVECYGDDIWEIIKALKKVLDETDEVKKDLLALHYFPVVTPISNYVSSIELWSEGYYEDLELIYEKLIGIMPSNSLDNRERQFYYNISW